MWNIFVPVTDLLIPMLLLWQLLSTEVSEMFWVMSWGLTSASPQANTSEQALKKQGFTPHWEQQFVELSQKRHSEYRRENGLLCIWDDFSASSVLMLHYQSSCGVWGRGNQLHSFLERIGMISGEYTMQLNESLSIQTLQRSKQPLQSAQLHHENGFCHFCVHQADLHPFSTAVSLLFSPLFISSKIFCQT